MKASVTLRAPAKLNLTLEVLGKRPDGYHGIRTVMVPIDRCDEIAIAPGEPGIAFQCDRAELQAGNLVERAFAALDLQSAAYRVDLRKFVPTGAGMGGGSSDAAAVLLAARRGCFGAIGTRDYLGLARALGSDVPFFLVETAALVEGTGERVTALGAVPPWHAIIVKPEAAVSTKWAYERIDAHPKPSRGRSDSVSLDCAEALQRADFERVVSLLSNDFHDVFVASIPAIGEAVAALEAAGATKALMTGSGSAVFALARTREECEAIAARLHLPAGAQSFTARFWNGDAWRNAA